MGFGASIEAASFDTCTVPARPCAITIGGPSPSFTRTSGETPDRVDIGQKTEQTTWADPSGNAWKRRCHFRARTAVLVGSVTGCRISRVAGRNPFAVCTPKPFGAGFRASFPKVFSPAVISQIVLRQALLVFTYRRNATANAASTTNARASAITVPSA